MIKRDNIKAIKTNENIKTSAVMDTYGSERVTEKR
jgi:hypothetical protein